MRILKNNGLTFALLGLFFFSLIGQISTGHREHNDDLKDHGRPELSLRAYFTSGHLWEVLAENWESEFLQMAAFVILTVFLFQKGSPESKDPDEPDDPVNADPRAKSQNPNAPWPVRKGGVALMLYSYSLSLVFVILFLGSFILHAWGGSRDYNEAQIEHGHETVTMLGYIGTSRFWHESFQNWQSEFLSLAAMVYLSVFLRQRGSAESKPVATPHDEVEDDD